MTKNYSGSHSSRALTAFLMILFALNFSQLLAAGKRAAPDAEARVIYSGQFKGHVEPCG